MSATARTTWQTILEMTGRMQLLSEQEEWESLASLAVERQAALEHFFASSDIAVDEVVEISQGIQQMLAADRQLMSLSVTSLAEISDTLHGLSNSRKAIQQYENCRR